jgi:osmotically-inducible protein OsmY
MSRRDLDRYRGYDWPRRSEENPFADWNEEWDQEKWDREHWERWMDTVRANQKDPHESDGTIGGTAYGGGVFTSASYGGGAEYYSVTGMYENPLLETWRKSHKGKGPKGYKRSDESIHDEVCERLTRHPLVDATLMYVEVEGGEVTLTGEVLDRRMKHMAEDIVDEVSGVSDIHNKLRVSRDRAA